MGTDFLHPQKVTMRLSLGLVNSNCRTVKEIGR